MNLKILCLIIFYSSNLFAGFDLENISENDKYDKQKANLQFQAAGYSQDTIRNVNKDIVVATIDTGLEISEQFEDSVYINKGESGIVNSAFCQKLMEPLKDKSCNKATNGIDDDYNGYVDDTNGWDFVSGTNKIQDTHGHGTHVAGIIASKNYGIAHGVKIMSLNYYVHKKTKNSILKKLEKRLNTKDIGDISVELSLDALEYAINNGANIINYSGGGPVPVIRERNLFLRAEKKGILVIVAAGNNEQDLDKSGQNYFPCSYHLSNMICVGNYNTAWQPLSPSSNYGSLVDVFAPGTQIRSTLPNGTSGWLTGTSQATPFITGLAALVYSANPQFTALEVKGEIMGHSKKLLKLEKLCSSSGLIDIDTTLNKIKDSKRNLASEETKEISIP